MSATEQQGRADGAYTKPDRWTRVRDGITFLGAWGIIAWQMLGVKPSEVNESFLILAASLLGFPFGAEAWQRIRSGGTPTTLPDSPPQSAPSPPSSSS